MIPSEITADHDGDCVVLRSKNREKLARITAEDAIKLAHEILDQADKALQHSELDADD